MLKSGTLRFFVVLLLLSACSLGSQSQQLVTFSGITPVGTAAPAQSVTVTLPAGGAVSQVQVYTQGGAALDFGDAADTCKGSFSAGATCTVSVSFLPTAPGVRRGAVVLRDSSNRTLATSNLAATASGPLATFIPGRATSVAGNSAFIYAGDGGPASAASIFLPFGLALNAAGDYFIADTYNNRIRKVNGKTAIITTVAGNGSVGSTGDGGSALRASLDNPSSVALDAAGNLYIADTGNHLIRFVDSATGLISTVAGTRTGPGYSGDGGPAVSASLNTPNGLAFDASGNLYIADTGNNVIRFLNVSTGIISTVAGTGNPAYGGDGGKATAASLKRPWGVTLAPTGELYIADQGNHAVRRVDTAGTITTIAGSGAAGYAGDGGPASASRLNTPAGIAIDVVGNIYIADSGNNRIRRINSATGIIATAAGSGSNGNTGDGGPATSAAIYGPYTIAFDGGGNLFVADVFHNRIRKILSNIGVLVYPTMRVGSVSAPMNQTIENDGNSPLDLTTITAVKNAVVDPATTCSSAAPLASLAQCVVTAEFAPTSIGNPVTGSIQIGSNGTNAPSTLLLQAVVQSTNPSTVLLSSSPNPSVVGNPVVFSVQVVSAGVLPTGAVTLLEGSTTLATQPLVNGLANITLSNLAVGQHSLTASYAGDTNTGSGVSLPLLQIVGTLPANSGTTTSLTASANPVGVGQPLVLIASVAPVTAGGAALTGTVAFMEGSTTLGTASIVGSSATFTTSSLAVGTHALTAVYSGSTSYATSVSAVLNEVVTATPPVVQPFTLEVTPTAVSLASGSHTTLQLTLTTSGSFSDTLSLGCGGLPVAATCTFSQTQFAVTPGTTKTLTVLLDTGNPLGSGPTASLRPRSSGASESLLASILPLGALLALLVGRGGRRLRGIGLLAFALLLGTSAALSGCGSSYTVHPTAAGSYTVQIIATGSTTGASAAVPVQLTVTK